MERTRFMRFMVTGGIAAIVNLSSRILLNDFMSFASAVAVAYLIGMITAYALVRLFVFERSGRAVADELWRFTVVNLLAAAQVWIISVGLGEYLFPASHFNWHPLDVAHLIGVSVPVLTSYLGHRHFSFARVGQ
jgi:putative flippase GtrA